jgi:hypothetical protein
MRLFRSFLLIVTSEKPPPRFAGGRTGPRIGTRARARTCALSVRFVRFA